MQTQLCADIYENLKQYVQNRADNLGINPGKAIVMPSSFIGGPKYMRKQYNKAMTMCRRESPPDLFITMTANTKWREIQEALEPNQKSEDRPD